MERKPSSKRNYDDFIQVGSGLVCSKCNRLACLFCLNKLTACIGAHSGSEDVWYQNVMKYIDEGIVVDNFIGHCCELKYNRNDIDRGTMVKKI